MLTVTEIAKEKFKEFLKNQVTDPGTIIRIIISPSDPNRFEIVLDKEKKGDKVVVSEGDSKLLVIAPDVDPSLDGMIIDYQETPQGGNFTMSNPAPDA